ncbi:DUF3048 domain-containing protein [Oceanobacillus profundus]|uniref:DUF3048 domain-containing protein n=1 Tax=Oceanobacillus TaxID=182709 RepID=UPI0026E205FD|nr:DUF3048 domain-containing protein [Oceanobacillus profundus]MDO6448911.1 DUF3048 domain-containing protein [Oceanobacillus profundus]
MKKLLLLTLTVFVLALAACSSDNQASDDNKKKDNVPEQQPEGNDRYAATFPLSGIETDESVDNRTIGVMINNHAAARPQSGLSEADIVFEILAEGTITRFLALYQSELPEVVGPVRSAREYYFELAEGYDAIYVYHGAADFVNDMIVNRGINFLNGSTYDNDGILFKRESFRKAPHNSYLQLGAVYDVASTKGYETTSTQESLNFLTEEKIETLGGEKAAQVKVEYGDNTLESVEYTYDEASGKYARSSNGEPSVDLNTETAIQVDNVFIVEAFHEVIDDSGRRAIDLKTGGDGYLIQKGQVQEIQWENKDGRIIPVKDGQPIGLVPGKTWVNVVPTDPGIKQSVTISNE